MTERVRLTAVERMVERQLPGLLSPTHDQARLLFRDEHSLFHGEMIRWFGTLRRLDATRASLDIKGYEDWKKRDVLLRTLHDLFVGDLRDETQPFVPIYRGTPADFDANQRSWSLACNDVEAIYPYVMSFLPETVTIKGEKLHLHKLLAREACLTEHDPLELIEHARRHDDPRLAHFARHKLVLGQMAFEARRDGYAPEALESEKRLLERFLTKRLFRDEHGKPTHGEEISIVAELDPENEYLCKKFQTIEPGETPPDPQPNRFILKGVVRYYVRVKKSGRRIAVYFFARSKRHILVKQLHKEIRFLQLIGIGDPIGIMMAVDDSNDLADLYEELRPVLVSCPGQVCDQASSLSYLMGQDRLDGSNRHSSKKYQATKYVARMCDRSVEVQFVPLRSLVDAKCSHSDVNHGVYKLKKFLELVFPILFPERLFGVSWQSKVLSRYCKRHVLAHPEKFVS